MRRESITSLKGNSGKAFGGGGQFVSIYQNLEKNTKQLFGTAVPLLEIHL